MDNTKMNGSDVTLRLLTVHAHPDDEASKGSALVHKYVNEGVGATLVCATGGELGSVLNPAMDRPEVRENLASVRQQELMTSAAIIGFDRVEMLGYCDSGMADSDECPEDQNFANAPIEEAVEKLVRIIRRDQPQVILTYGDEQGAYPHPDHLRVHDVTIAAFDAAGDPDRFPDAGEPWEPQKLYYSVWAREKMVAIHETMIASGLESPFPADWIDKFDQDERITTRVDVGKHFDVRDDSLRAHATQVDPESAFWFGLSPEESAKVYPFDDLILAATRIETEFPESDLFAGLR